jgi:hypothetical protein
VTKPSPGVSNKYLGFLCTLEDYRLYGYVTSGGVKLILALDEGSYRDEDLRNVREKTLQR